jgi:hypothetical protein
MTGLLKFCLPQAGSVSAVLVIAVFFIRNDTFILSVFIFNNFYIKDINIFNVNNKYVSY